ncbi:phage holin [uncultured Vagococcus sp.]|uniref:phage holin n=1 Tax=uncultured Vagococcus sp. TaxID=189676 RepID=UPI0028D19B8E|nr:phage holin [uncultured Vagococcus sp.]
MMNKTDIQLVGKVSDKVRSFVKVNDNEVHLHCKLGLLLNNHGMSQKDLIKLTGIPQNQVSGFVTNRPGVKLAFIARFAAAVLIPILAYFGYKFEDITSWAMVGTIFIQFVSNPFLVGLTLVNAFNIVPDSTTDGIADSNRAMKYVEPGKTKRDVEFYDELDDQGGY